LPDGTEKEVGSGSPQLKLLPRRIIGYSSGLNETVSHPFQRTKTIYSEEVRDAAPAEGQPEQGDVRVADTRTLYMDYESNSAIIIANYIFQDPEHLKVFTDFTRVKGVTSFTLRFNRKRAGKSGANSVVRLTSELRGYLKKFAACADQEVDENALSHSFDFVLNEKTRAKLRAEFTDAETFFMAMYKWSLLNALILSDDQRKVYLSSDITKGALERPPSVPPSDRVFDIKHLKLRLSEPDMEIDYSGLSDGEHQFMQVFGTVLLFNAPGSLFLFDEPESHFNPEWRTKFNLILDRLPNADRQEYIISTHSPYLVSGAREWNVFKFVRAGSVVSFEPVKFETYGAPFDQLLKNLFSISTTIDESARAELQEIISRNREDEMKSAVDEFAESKEKRRLYEAILRKEQEGQ
jgi:restriction system-associated AAA family ATPase